jgi:phosphatidylglycerol---prolipoprotein diacylglyceryl transferase
MFTIDINPVAFTMGPLVMSWSTLWLIAGIIVALPIILIEGKRNNLKRYQSISLYLIVIILAYSLARMLFLIENIVYYGYDSNSLSSNGIRIIGASGGGILGAFIYSKISHVSFFKLIDSGTIALFTVLTLLRIGCFMVGCCYGVPSDLPWSIQYTQSSEALINIPIHPTQAYHFIAGGLTVLCCWFFRKKLNKQGTLGCLGFVLFGFGDLIVRFFRANEPMPSISFFLGIALTVSFSILFFIRLRKQY